MLQTARAMAGGTRKQQETVQNINHNHGYWKAREESCRGKGSESTKEGLGKELGIFSLPKRSGQNLCTRSK